MKLSLTSLCTGYRDLDSEFVLESEESKYLFNVRDGTQRLCMEHSIRLSKLKMVFFSRIAPDTLGGFPGMLLSIYDMGIRELSIYGPEGISSYIISLQLFINRYVTLRPDYRISVVELESDIPEIDLHNGAVIHPFILPVQTVPFVREVIHIQDYLDLTISRVVREKPCYASEISFLIDIPFVKGKFCPEEAIRLGVPKGSMFRILCDGGSVTIDGKEITSDMVMSPPSRGPSVLLLNLHSSSFLTDFFASLLPQINTNTSLITIFVNSPSVIRQQITLSSSVQQVILPDSEPYYPIVHTASTLVCSHLHLIFPSLFPQHFTSLSFPSNSYHYLQCRESMVLAPLKKKGFISPPNPVFDNTLTDAEVALRDKFVALSENTPKTGIPGSLLFLGTGSAVPSKYRNVSSSLLELKNGDLVLLDCGEGTMTQLLRIYANNWISLLSRLRFILISHSHADHHLGIPLLLQFLSSIHSSSPVEESSKRMCCNLSPIYIFGTPRLGVFLQTLTKFMPHLASSFEFVPLKLANRPFFFPPNQTHPTIVQEAFTTTFPLPPEVTIEELPQGSQRIQFPYGTLVVFPMFHIDDAVAILVQTEDLSVLYTGDGRPAFNAEEYLPKGTTIDILVNESTFTSDHQESALIKNHCTMEEAIEVGKRLKAKYTILTHFSQRYPKNLDHDQGAHGDVVSVKSLKERAGDYQSFICGHDLMKVSFSDLDILCQIRDDLEACFIDEDDFIVC